MKKQNLEILGLDEGATREDVQTAYDSLRQRYLEERFMDGEAGNNAAKMLTKIETAYTDLMSEFSETADTMTEGSQFAKVEELIKGDSLQEAQRTLDAFNERNGYWHYLQSVLFYKKNWINESKKQLEIAIQLEPDNEKYKQAYKKLNEKINTNAQSAGAQGQGGAQQNRTVYEGQTMDSYSDDQMGGNFCASCIQCCYINMCINCLCNGCCR